MVTLEKHNSRQKMSVYLGEDSSTPLETAQEMISKIPLKVLRNTKSRFLDPCAGTGTFLVALFHELKKYHSEEHILTKMLHACEIDKFKLRILKNLGVRNIYEGSYFEKEFGMKFDIVIGNPPYQLNNSDSSNTTALYDKFYYIAKEVSKQYISFVIPYEWTKRNNSKFKKEMFDSGVLSKLNVHTRQEFKGIQKVTCDFLVDLKKTSKEVEVSTNKGLDNTLTLSSESLLLNNLTLLEKPSTGLDLLWKRGTTSISELSEKGKYPVVYSLGGKKPIKILYSDTETTGLGKWKVAVSNLGGIGNIGAVKILPPEYAHNYSIVSFAVGSESEAVDLQKYLTSENIRELVQNAKGSTPNSKSIFSYIEYDRTTS